MSEEKTFFTMNIASEKYYKKASLICKHFLINMRFFWDTFYQTVIHKEKINTENTAQGNRTYDHFREEGKKIKRYTPIDPITGMYFGTRISVSYIYNEMYKTPIVEDDDVCNSSGEILAQKYRFQKAYRR